MVWETKYAFQKATVYVLIKKKYLVMKMWKFAISSFIEVKQHPEWEDVLQYWKCKW